jgi:hypothetical protein
LDPFYIAVFGQDPGGHTGVAWGVFKLDLLDLGEIMRTRSYSSQEEVTGDEYDQIKDITDLWQKFARTAVFQAGVPHSRVYYVCEDFVLRPGPNVGGKEGTSPERIMWGVEGYRLGQADQWNRMRRGRARKVVVPRMILQQPSQAKTFATGRRLREWDAWVVGKEHARSAWQHIGLFVAGYLNAYQQNLARNESI